MCLFNSPKSCCPKDIPVVQNPTTSQNCQNLCFSIANTNNALRFFHIKTGNIHKTENVETALRSISINSRELYECQKERRDRPTEIPMEIKNRGIMARTAEIFSIHLVH